MNKLELIDTKKSQVEDVYKLVFKDEDVLEVSYIRKNDGKDILVVPTQTSCSMGCTFCFLTAMNIPAKNLHHDRILNLIDASLDYQKPKNDTLLISYMGSGEPMLNCSGVINSALDLKYNEHWEHIQKSYKNIRFAISTILPGKNRFKTFKENVITYKLPFKLHWSLHSLNVPSRKSLMPAASPVVEGLEMIEEYMEETEQPVEIHYTLINNVNDSEEDLDKFEKLVTKKANIKILKFAEKKEKPDMYESANTAFFRKGLEDRGFMVEVYSPPGRDISASCGMFILDQYTK